METLPCDFREGMETLPCEIREAIEVLDKDKAERIQEIAEKQAIEMIQWYYDKLKEKEPDSYQDSSDYEDSSSSDDEDSCEFDEDRCRRDWNRLYAGVFGSFDDFKSIPAMRYTDKPAPPNSAWEDDTLQIFSIEVMGREQQKLEWPLDVFGMVAARDSLDHNRNIIFSRERDNCQTISEESPYLELTGPTRAVVVSDRADFEVKLKVKGASESEDEYLSCVSIPYNCYSRPTHSRLVEKLETSRLTTLKLTLGFIVDSVEATISVRVISGSWPECSRSLFTASTASIDHMKVTLLDFEGDGLPVAADGNVQLSRRVASVELAGELRVSAEAQCEDETLADVKSFYTKEGQ
ncbi:hypothetical protein CFC21_010757 [Triticum aestivum]|uniref:DUF6598 domain-containing protein n=2 Tax=Triticum aestivum TaxID=4565 RepID=A0A9R1DLE7_WHEAT|nr:uncharacterized protein LOC123166328 [Triticum aestivum]KAF6993941.1 hypothetical protein CFC21_010754 [Triticum aestivum]KAF6993944.1 hypothetical protein CFC21_010757 [Triticum aestivum]